MHSMTQPPLYGGGDRGSAQSAVGVARVLRGQFARLAGCRLGYGAGALCFVAQITFAFGSTLAQCFCGEADVSQKTLPGPT